MYLSRTLGGGLTKDDARRKGFKIPVKEYMTLLSKYLRKQRAGISVLSILIAMGIGFQLINPQIVRRFLDSATSSAPLETLLIYATLFLGLAICIRLVRAFEDYMGHTIAWKSTNALRFDLVKHILSIDMSYHTKHPPGELIERIDGDVHLLSHFFSNFALELVANFFFTVGVLIVLYIEDWRIGLSFTVYAAVVILVVGGLRNFAIPYRRKFQTRMADQSSFLEESFSSLEDIRSVSAQSYFKKRYLEIIQKNYRTGLNSALAGQVMVNAASFMFPLGTAIACAVGSILFVHKGISIGTVYLIVQYAALLVSPLQQISGELQTLQSSGAAISRTNELLSSKSALPGGDRELTTTGPSQVTFEQVCFAYIPKHPVLTDVSFSLPPGSVTGLVGRTGSGKTTVSRLLFRFYDPVTGSVQINNTDLKSYSLESLRKTIGLVTQDVQLFSASVRDNISMFDRNVSDEKIERILEYLGIDNWINTLPERLDTRLGSDGIGLSSGESQLVAFARVFLNDPSIIILDEASSRLDPATEAILENALDRLFKDRTVLVIAHRLSTIEKSDQLLVMESGRIIESGSPQALRSDSQSRFSQMLAAGEDLG